MSVDASMSGMTGAGSTGPSNKEELPGVLIYTPHLLSTVQHYVRQHAEQLTRYRPVLGGRRSIEGTPYKHLPNFTFGDGIGGRLRELRYLMTGKDGGLKAFIQQQKIKLIHAHFGPGGVEIMPLAAELGIPLIVTFHGWDIKLGPEAELKMSRYERGYRKRLPQLFEQATEIICVSESWRERVIELGCPAEKARTNYLGIDLSFFDGVRGKVDPLSIVYVGRLVRRKGVRALLEALHLLRSRGVMATLTVIGEGAEMEPLRAFAMEKNLPVEFLGKKKPVEIRELLRDAAVLCAPSMTQGGEVPEALGLVLLEAEAMGVPVVGTRNGGIPETLEDGKTGFLVNEENPAELAEALEKLLGNEAINREFGLRAREFVCERFEIGRCYSHLEAMYDEILQRG